MYQTGKKFQILILFMACLAMFMDAVDSSIVNIALPELALSLNSDTGTVSWVSLAYLLVIAGTVLTFGKTADKGHLKGVFICGFAVFTLASAFCGFSSSLELLLVSRVVQGAGAGMLIACAPLLCVTYLSPKMIGLSMGLITAVSSVGFAAGPALGGVLLHFLSWHWIFLINIPIGICAVLLALRYVPKSDRVVDEPFDFIGSILVFLMMASCVFCLERFPHLGFSPMIIGAFLLFAVSAVLFVIRERTASYPLMNLSVFRDWNLAFVTIAYIVVQIAGLSLLYLLPFYMSVAAGYSALLSGVLLFIPAGITAVLGGYIGKLSDARGRRAFVLVSLVFLLAGNILCSVMEVSFGMQPLVAALVLLGLYWGFSGGTMSSRIVDYMPEDEKGTGSTLMVLAMYFGTVLGTAFSASVFTFLTSGIGSAVLMADLPLETFMYGFHGTFVAAAVVGIFVMIISAVVKDRPAGE